MLSDIIKQNGFLNWHESDNIFLFDNFYSYVIWTYDVFAEDDSAEEVVIVFDEIFPKISICMLYSYFCYRDEIKYNEWFQIDDNLDVYVTVSNNISHIKKIFHYFGYKLIEQHTVIHENQVF